MKRPYIYNKVKDGIKRHTICSKLSGIIATFAVCLSLSSCIEESTPTNGATDKQLESASLLGLSNSIAGYMNKNNTSSSDYTAIGYPGLMLWREVMANDWAPLTTDYDYFTYYASGQYIGDYYTQGMIWMFYYYLIQKCNLLIGMENASSQENRPYLGNALVYRAMAYFDLARMYEYKHTGIANLDTNAEELGCIGLTVPITTEKTTEEESRHNPRAPFYEMYRMILTDLQRAEEMLQGVEKARVKSEASLAVCHGMMARFWLELATRFEKYPEDLATTVSFEKEASLSKYKALEITTAKECFAKASTYAQQAIGESGCRPLKENEWYNPNSGFNTANDAWMWAILMGSNDASVTDYSWDSWISFTAPEADFGVSSTKYRNSRMIDASLFNSIPQTDWRRYTWIDPADYNKEGEEAEDNFKQKYQSNHNVTSLSYEEWKQLGAYVGFKFHPGQGNRTVYKTGNDVDIPLMRIEEMYLINAEAIAHINGWAEGAKALTDFVSTYRDTSYSFEASTQSVFEEELLRQKRIEFWGEGITMFDFKRLEHAVCRGYSGTNHPSSYRLNSIEGCCPPWMTIYITSGEATMNDKLILNPNPSGAVSTWDE